MTQRWSDCEIPLGNPWPIDGDRRRYDPVTATIAGVGAGVSLLRGRSEKNTANNEAANLQGVAAKSGQQIIDTTGAANNQLSDMTGDVNNNINRATGAAIERTDAATDNANALLSPYRQSGEEANEALRKGLIEGGDFNRNFLASDAVLDPGYEFQRAEGEKFAKAQQAAGGSQFSGAAQKALVRYNQDYAGTGFQKAFERYRNQNQDRYDRLFGVSKQGQTAATTSGNNLIEGGKYGSNLTVDAANATGKNTLRTGEVTSGRTIDAEAQRQGLVTDAASVAAGAKIQGNSAMWNGVSGAVDSVGSGVALGRLLKNPASRVNYLDPATTARINGRLPAGVRP